MFIETGKYVEDTSGEEFVILTTHSPQFPRWPVLVMNIHSGDLLYYGKDGTKSGQFDLVEAKPRIRRTFWLNVYSSGAVAYDRKCGADEGATPHRIACVSVDVNCREGEGL